MAPAVVGRAAQPQPQHSLKRPAKDELEDEQPLTKKFGRLQLGQSSKLGQNGHDAAPSKPKHPVNLTKPSHHAGDDAMHVDDTKTRVFISDLDSELAEIEEQENDIAFLPEIEKKLMAIPKSVLRHRPSSDNALVLYKLPPALGMTGEEDTVRSVIDGARDRAREKSILDVERDMHAKEGRKMGYHVANGIIPPWAMNAPSEPRGVAADDDAMEIDYL